MGSTEVSGIFNASDGFYFHLLSTFLPSLAWDESNLIARQLPPFGQSRALYYYAITIPIMRLHFLSCEDNSYHAITIPIVRLQFLPCGCCETASEADLSSFECKETYLLPITSPQGRVAIEYFDSDANTQGRKYAFKCHRRDDRAFPVSSIAFHPIYGTLQTISVLCACCPSVCSFATLLAQSKEPVHA